MQEKFQKVFDSITREVSLNHFEQYVLHSSQHLEELFTSIRECKTQGFPRFNIWRMLLEVIPISGNWEQKKASLEAARKRWGQLKEESKTGIKASDKPKQPVNVPKNPLMKMGAKPQKKQIQSDSFLNEEIKKDVDRTYQEMTFFQDPEILKLLSNVLFVWCKINPDISYKQGMNELLASIVYVYFKEAVPANFEASTDIEQKYLFLNSITHAEPDIYIIFEKIMEIQKDMYKQNLDNDVKGLVNPNSKNNSPILQRIIQIQDQKLKSTDLELFRILKLQDVKTKTFLLRWIRCLHTREFGLVNSLFIWDSIFLDAYESPNSKNRKQYEFVDAMCLAMFIYLRAVVLTRETSNEILQIYQKYPQLEGQYLFELIRLAWSVCEQLRNLTNNPGSNSNWYQESQKIKKLGLMEKGGFALTMKKEEPQKTTKNNDHLSTTSPIKDNDALLKKSPLKEDKPADNNRRDIPKQDVAPAHKAPSPLSKAQGNEYGYFMKPKESSAPKTDSILRHRNIVFEQREVTTMIQNLKQSIKLNDDIQSRALANKVLKLLESKADK